MIRKPVAHTLRGTEPQVHLPLTSNTLQETTGTGPRISGVQVNQFT